MHKIQHPRICYTLRPEWMVTLNCHLYLTVTALKRPSSVQRRHYGAVGARELLRPYLLWIPSVIRFRFNGRRSLLQSALRRFILHPLDSCNFEHSRRNYVTVLILMRIATRMRDCQCFPSTRHKEINKNSLREALPFLFVTQWRRTLCATFPWQDGDVLNR